MQKITTMKSNREQLGDLHDKEISLILHLREKCKWGEVTIEMRAGLPDRISEVVRYNKV